MSVAAIYVRVSTAKQAKHGTSLADMERQCRDLITRNADWSLADKHVYIDVMSGGIKHRPKLDALLDALDEIDILITPRIDRLGRNTKDNLDLFDAVLAADVELHQPDGKRLTKRDRFIYTIESAVAERERELIAERVSGTAALRAAEGFFPGGRRAPFGYRREPLPGTKRTVLVTVPEEAAIVLRIFKEAAAGKSQRDILIGLERDGIKTKEGHSWEQGTVGRMLRYELYAGYVKVKGEVYPGKHEAIVPEDLWNKVRELAKARATNPHGGKGRHPKGTHLLTGGMLRCGHCGGSMGARTYKSGLSVYICTNRHKTKGTNGCQMLPGVLSAPVDGAVVPYFQRVGLDVDSTRRAYAAAITRRVDEARVLREAAEREAMTATARLDRVKRAFQDGHLHASDWAEQRTELVAERDAAMARVDRLTRQEADEAKGDALGDAEAEVLRLLAQMRTLAASEVVNAETTAAVRAALARLFDAFILRHESWGPTYGYSVHVEMPGGWTLEPVPKASMWVGTELAETPDSTPDAPQLVSLPWLRKVSLDIGETKRPTA